MQINKRLRFGIDLSEKIWQCRAFYIPSHTGPNPYGNKVFTMDWDSWCWLGAFVELKTKANG